MIERVITSTNNRGIILLELLIVVMIIGVLIAGAVRTWDVTINQTRFNETQKEMDQLVYAIVGNPELFSEGRRTDFGYVGDMGVLPETLLHLVASPSGATTWRGPYIKVKFAENPNDYLQDAWGNNYFYDEESLLIRSYTSGSILTPQTWINRKIAKDSNEILNNRVNGYVKDIFGNPPAGKDSLVKIFITYPIKGVLYCIDPGVRPDQNGYYSLSNRRIPQGNHRMICIYYDTNLLDTIDLVEKTACIYPGIDNTVDFRLTIRF